MTSIMPTHESFFTPNSLKYHHHHHIVPQNGWGRVEQRKWSYVFRGRSDRGSCKIIPTLGYFFLKSFCYKNHKMVFGLNKCFKKNWGKPRFDPSLQQHSNRQRRCIMMMVPQNDIIHLLGFGWWDEKNFICSFWSLYAVEDMIMALGK